jgi:hypothetical protein
VTDGLRLGLAASVDDAADRAAFDVSFRNAGTKDFVLNLGTMLANGRVMWPDAVRVNLTRPSGETCERRYHDRRFPMIAGRMDDFIVALPAGAVYTLRLTSDHLWCADPFEFETTLEPGHYRVEAHFEGRGAQTTNLDMTGVPLLNFWKGAVRSGQTSFEVGRR